MHNFGYYNARPITKAMLTWWAYTMEDQPLLSLETVLEIEHIYARNRHVKETENPLSNPGYVDKLGNKALLEKRVNIRASDYRFADKAKFYKGFVNNRGQMKEGTKVTELLKLADEKTDFTEKDILDRHSQILNAFFSYLSENELVK